MDNHQHQQILKNLNCSEKFHTWLIYCICIPSTFLLLIYYIIHSINISSTNLYMHTLHDQSMYTILNRHCSFTHNEILCMLTRKCAQPGCCQLGHVYPYLCTFSTGTRKVDVVDLLDSLKTKLHNLNIKVVCISCNTMV